MVFEEPIYDLEYTDEELLDALDRLEEWLKAASVYSYMIEPFNFEEDGVHVETAESVESP